MREQKRRESIDRYMRALDEEDFSIVRPVLSPNVVYHSMKGDLHGIPEVETFFESKREARSTVHEISRVVHDEEVSFAEGTVDGTLPDVGEFEAGFCIGFEFDTSSIARISVYVRR